MRISFGDPNTDAAFRQANLRILNEFDRFVRLEGAVIRMQDPITPNGRHVCRRCGLAYQELLEAESCPHRK
jgi:hypothetical protein